MQSPCQWKDGNLHSDDGKPIASVRDVMKNGSGHAN